MNATSLKPAVDNTFDAFGNTQTPVRQFSTVSTLARTRIEPARTSNSVRAKVSREEALRQAILRTG